MWTGAPGENWQVGLIITMFIPHGNKQRLKSENRNEITWTPKFDKIKSTNLRRHPGNRPMLLECVLIKCCFGSLIFILQLTVYGVACISAFGCEPLVAPPGVWMRISNDFRSHDGELYPMATMTAVFRCNVSEEAWHLLCRGTRWIGHVGNCSSSLLSGFSWSQFRRCSIFFCAFFMHTNV